MPIEKIVAQIEPKQDLNGYDNPWPAGGGKNLFDADSLISGGINGQGGDAANSGWRRTPYMYMKAGTYTISRASADWWKMFKYSDQSTSSIIGQVFNNNTRLTETFTLDSDCYCRFGFDYIPTTADAIQLEAGSTATAWTPYSNICPISGWTGLTGARTGKNLLNPEYRNNLTANIQFYHNTAGLLLKANTAYTISASSKPTQITIISADGTTLDTNYGQASLTYTPTEDVYVWFDVFYLSSAIPSGGLESVNCQLEVGSSASSYEPYTGEEISVSWQDEAGTVYGGTATYNGDGTWTLVADHAIVDLGTLTWNKVATSIAGKYRQYSTNLVGYAKAVARNNELASITCETYPAKTADQTYGRTFGISINTSANVLVYDEMYSGENDSAAFTASVSGVKLAYPVVNPQTYTITTGELIDTLVGQNNVFVDTGDVSVTYQSTSGSTPVRTSFRSPLRNYSYSSLKLFNYTFIEHGKG